MFLSAKEMFSTEIQGYILYAKSNQSQVLTFQKKYFAKKLYGNQNLLSCFLDTSFTLEQGSNKILNTLDDCFSSPIMGCFGVRELNTLSIMTITTINTSIVFKVP